MDKKQLLKSLALAYSPLLANIGNAPDAFSDVGIKPTLQPPDWVFGPVWLTLFGLIGVANARFNEEAPPEAKLKGNALNALHLSLDAAFIVVGFGLKSRRGALGVIVPLWLAIASTILHYRKHSKRAAPLLLPYFAWISFATYLIWESVRLNDKNAL